MLNRTIALPPAVPILVIGAVCIFSVWKGDREERIAGIAFAIGVVTAPLLKDRQWVGPQWGNFALDAAYFALLIGMALRTRKYWPLFAAGFQLLLVLTHAASMVDHQLGAWAYITAGVIWTYLGLFALGAGAWNSFTRRRDAEAFKERAP